MLHGVGGVRTGGLGCGGEEEEKQQEENSDLEITYIIISGMCSLPTHHYNASLTKNIFWKNHRYIHVHVERWYDIHCPGCTFWAIGLRV